MNTYNQTKRIDWIRNQLVDEKQFNCNTVCNQFNIDLRTAARDIAFLKSMYPGKIHWSYKFKSFYLSA